MFCPMCGKEIKDGSKFCSKCGARIENRQEPVPAGVPLSQAGQSPSHPAQPQQPSAQRPVQPTQSSVQPAQRPAQPAQSSVQPARRPAQPAQSLTQPGQSSVQPAQRPAQPPQSVQPPPPVQPPQSPPPAPPQPPEKKKKGGIIIIILAIVLVVLLAAGAGTLYYIKQSRDAKQQKIEAESRQAEEAKEKKEKEKKEKKEQESREAESQAAESSQAAQEKPAQAQAGGKNPAAEAAAPAPATCTLVYGNQADFSGLSKISIQKGNVTQSSNVVQKNNPNIDNTGWSAFDGVLKTSWQEGAAGNGLGEYVSARFDQVYQVKLITFDLGNHRSGDWYYKNNRPRVLGITLGGQTFHVEFPDEMTEYAIIFSDPISATDLTVTIEDIYPGTEYSDTTISEIGVYSN